MPELKINGYTFATQADGNNPVLASNVNLGSATFPAGHVIQVKSTSKSDVFSTTAISQSTWVTIPGLSLDITISEGNHVLLIANVFGSGSDATYSYADGWRLRIARGTSTFLAYDDVKSYAWTSGSDLIGRKTINYYDQNLIAGTYTYSLQIAQKWGGSAGLYVNQNGLGGMTYNSTSNFTIMEIQK